LSQGQLADMAGVSKVIISQIEKGDSNPTINTIWKLTGALELPYTSLLEMDTVKTEHIKKRDVAELVEDKYHIFSYYPKNADRNFELYEIEMEAGCSHPSIGHSTKSYEYVFLTEGQIVITVNDTEYALEKEDTIFYDASVPHCYRNDTSHIAKMVLIIQYL
ncbi:MAG: XRE family transcriptional regulator, partial [Fusicatenibacter sp.]|nr:XRE family transcriptional regulator [Fusicatenibacter sp.]